MQVLAPSLQWFCHEWKKGLKQLIINISTGPQRTRQQITLEIAAENLNDITRFKEELKDFEVDQCHTETIEVHQQLDDRQFRKIQEVQRLHNVRIDCNPAIGFIRISGLAKNVSNALAEIHRIIRVWETDKHHIDTVVREVLYFSHQFTNI